MWLQHRGWGETQASQCWRRGEEAGGPPGPVSHYSCSTDIEKLSLPPLHTPLCKNGAFWSWGWDLSCALNPEPCYILWEMLSLHRLCVLSNPPLTVTGEIPPVILHVLLGRGREDFSFTSAMKSQHMRIKSWSFTYTLWLWVNPSHTCLKGYSMEPSAAHTGSRGRAGPARLLMPC